MIGTRWKRGGLLAAATLVTLALAAAAHGASREADIAYGPEPRQRLDIYRPDDGGPAAPLLVFLYGGGWQGGSKDKPDIAKTAGALADAGLIVVVPDYRVFPEESFPAFVEDAAAAVALALELEGLPGGGHRPLFLAGHSAGAHIASLLVYDERWLAEAGFPEGSVEGFIGIAGPYDLRPSYGVLAAIFPAGERDRIHPAPFVDGSEPPALLVTGDADDTVDMGSTTRLAEAIRAAGGGASVLIEPGGDHLAPYLALAENGSAVQGAVLAFIAEHR